MRVYTALKVAYPLGCRNISKVIKSRNSVSYKSITQKTKSMKIKTFLTYTKYLQNLHT